MMAYELANQENCGQFLRRSSRTWNIVELASVKGKVVEFFQNIFEHYNQIFLVNGEIRVSYGQMKKLNEIVTMFTMFHISCTAPVRIDCWLSQRWGITDPPSGLNDFGHLMAFTCIFT